MMGHKCTSTTLKFFSEKIAFVGKKMYFSFHLLSTLIILSAFVYKTLGISVCCTSVLSGKEIIANNFIQNREV